MYCCKAQLIISSKWKLPKINSSQILTIIVIIIIIRVASQVISTAVMWSLGCLLALQTVANRQNGLEVNRVKWKNKNLSWLVTDSVNQTLMLW